LKVRHRRQGSGEDHEGGLGRGRLGTVSMIGGGYRS